MVEAPAKEVAGSAAPAEAEERGGDGGDSDPDSAEHVVEEDNLLFGSEPGDAFDKVFHEEDWSLETEMHECRAPGTPSASARGLSPSNISELSAAAKRRKNVSASMCITCERYPKHGKQRVCKECLNDFNAMKEQQRFEVNQEAILLWQKAQKDEALLQKLFFEFRARSPTKGMGIPRAPFDFVRFSRKYQAANGLRDAVEEDWFEEEEFLQWFMARKGKTRAQALEQWSIYKAQENIESKTEGGAFMLCIPTRVYKDNRNPKAEDLERFKAEATSGLPDFSDSHFDRSFEGLKARAAVKLLVHLNAVRSDGFTSTLAKKRVGADIPSGGVVGGGEGSDRKKRKHFDVEVELAKMRGVRNDILAKLEKSGSSIEAQTKSVTGQAPADLKTKLESLLKIAKGRTEVFQKWMSSSDEELQNYLSENPTKTVFSSDGLMSKKQIQLAIADVRASTEEALTKGAEQIDQMLGPVQTLMAGMQTSLTSLTKAIKEYHSQIKRDAEREAKTKVKVAAKRVAASNAAAQKQQQQEQPQNIDCRIFGLDFADQVAMSTCEYPSKDADMSGGVPYICTNMDHLVRLAMSGTDGAYLSRFLVKCPKDAGYQKKGRAQYPHMPNTFADLAVQMLAWAPSGPRVQKVDIKELAIVDGTPRMFAFHPFMKHVGTEFMESSSLRLHLGGEKKLICVRPGDVLEALRDKVTPNAASLAMVRDAVSSMTQAQLNELTAAGMKIFYHGHVPSGSLVYVPAGYIVAETCLNGSLVHGVRVGIFHSHPLALGNLRTLAQLCTPHGTQPAAAVKQLIEIADVMERKLGKTTLAVNDEGGGRGGSASGSSGSGGAAQKGVQTKGAGPRESGAPPKESGIAPKAAAKAKSRSQA